MSSRDTLIALTAQHASGKDGMVATIEAFAVPYREDSTILPTEFDKLNKRQAVAHWGGYLVAHKEFTADECYSFADVIGEDEFRALIDLTLETKALRAQLVKLDEARTAKNKSEADAKLRMGDTTTSLAVTMKKNFEDFKVAYNKTPTPKAEILLRGVVKELLEMLPSEASELLSA